MHFTIKAQWGGGGESEEDREGDREEKRDRNRGDRVRQGREVWRGPGGGVKSEKIGREMQSQSTTNCVPSIG